MSQRIKSFFSRQKKNAEDEQSHLARYGIDVTKSKALAERGEMIVGVLEDIEKTQDIVLKVNLIDKLLSAGAVPWGRGGDRGVFAQIMMYWNNLMMVWRDIAGLVAQYEEGDMKEFEDFAYSYMRGLPLKPRMASISIDDIIKLVHNFGMREMVPWGMKILAVSFLNADVAPAYAAIIVTQPASAQPGYLPVVPTSESGTTHTTPFVPSPDMTPVGRTVSTKLEG